MALWSGHEVPLPRQSHVCIGLLQIVPSGACRVTVVASPRMGHLHTQHTWPLARSTRLVLFRALSVYLHAAPHASKSLRGYGAEGASGVGRDAATGGGAGGRLTAGGGGRRRLRRALTRNRGGMQTTGLPAGETQAFRVRWRAHKDRSQMRGVWCVHRRHPSQWDRPPECCLWAGRQKMMGTRGEVGWGA